MARHTSGSGSGAFVTLLTAAALGVVAFFAYQASAADDRPAAGSSPSASETPEDGSQGGEGGEADPTDGPPPLPAESGEGKRVVYSLSQQRVWLVDNSADGTGEVIAGTYEVHPSSVSPPAGEYTVTSRFAQGTGSDGVAIEHSVVFHEASDGTVFGFSAALDGSTPDPDSATRTGAIRQSREHGDAMWLFATAGIPVVVVP
ncbi:hypothetical protein [Streptomyces litchfieldiae]|uniref:Secreted protein n=1 Tax=Streptomyces litchfieldiae TaxID=3075543 RepID=A0ABU2MWU5_9ACTN|nr:hypothetical protein [Streptomyces sp. DSM 44938]MDT0346131.1 hypothetical protein [Streptomyces sp. DSM 44938]